MICAPFMGAFWWVFPLVGLLVCAALAVIAFRVLSTGRGLACMGGHHASGDRETTELRREVDVLREQVRQLGAAR